jgi:Raf kinase inhibitor-like YbhB/YbcL family protein
MKRTIVTALLRGGIVLAFSCAFGTAQAQKKIFGVTSTTFKDGQMMPKKVANSRANFPQNEHCVGENVSPQLSWINPPPDTKSFAITMVDPEGRGGGGVNHWVAYGIPADITGFAEGEVSKESPKYVGGKSRLGVGHYSGPCAPDAQVRHYTFVVIATDFDPKELPPGLTKEELNAKIVPPEPQRRHDKAAAAIIGLFAKPTD